MMSRDYMTIKVWDLHMETKPIETYPVCILFLETSILILTDIILIQISFQVHEYLRPKLCSLYENDCIFDKFECCWSGTDQYIMTGAYNNFFRMFDRAAKRDVTLEASKEIAKPKTILKPRKVKKLSYLYVFSVYH